METSPTMFLPPDPEMFVSRHSSSRPLRPFRRETLTSWSTTTTTWESTCTQNYLLQPRRRRRPWTRSSTAEISSGWDRSTRPRPACRTGSTTTTFRQVLRNQISPSTNWTRWKINFLPYQNRKSQDEIAKIILILNLPYVSLDNLH